MKITKIALLLFFLFSIAATVANFMHWDGLKLFSFPLIIPSIIFYYLGHVKKVSLLLAFFLFFCFVGDAVSLMDFDQELIYLMGPFFMANILISIMAWKVRERFRWDVFNVFSLAIIVAFLLYLWKMVVSFFENDKSNMPIYVGVFGVTLVVMNLLSSFNIIWRMRMSNLYLLFATITILVSQLFYVMYNYELKLVVLDIIHFICQNLSYLFIVLFVIHIPNGKIRIGKL